MIFAGLPLGNARLTSLLILPVVLISCVRLSKHKLAKARTKLMYRGIH
jgi:hypothetical protein